MGHPDSWEALTACEKHLNTVLDSPLTTRSEDRPFSEDSIEDVRKIAQAATYHRKKKNAGVIGASAVGIIAGFMSIFAVFLAPVTFGGSIALLVSGGVIGVAGVSASLGFSIEKVIGDKKRFERFKPYLEMFVGMNKNIAEATVTIHRLLQFIKRNKTLKLYSEKLSLRQRQTMMEIEREVKLLKGNLDDAVHIYEKIKCIDSCVKNIHKKIYDLISPMFTLQTLQEFPSPKGEERERRSQEDNRKDDAFDCLVDAIPEERHSDEGVTFRVFLRRYFEFDTDIPKENRAVAIGTTSGGFAGGALRGAFVGARAATRAIEFADDAGKAGASFARIVKGVSVASIVLSSVGIVVDVAFLGHAVYDLLKIKKKDKKRKSGEANIATEDFADFLLDLADMMDFINTVCTVPVTSRSRSSYFLPSLSFSQLMCWVLLFLLFWPIIVKCFSYYLYRF